MAGSKRLLGQYQTDDDILELIFTRSVKSCPKCGYGDFYKVKNRKCYGCKKCSHQIYPLKGTIMQSTKLPLRDWIDVIAQIQASRNGLSAKTIQRLLGVTYKVAWNLTTKVRSLMKNDLTDKLSGVVEIDESYIGGKSRGKHAFVNKTTIFGMLERGGRVKVFVVDNRDKETILPLIEKHVEKGSTIYTDEHNIYSSLSSMGYTHESIQHNQYKWARGEVSTNAIEAFWSKIKNSLKGTNISVSKRKLQTYLDEFAFKHNRKGKTEREKTEMITNDIVKILVNSSIIRDIER